MSNVKNIVYSRAAATRILGLEYRQVREVREFANSVWVYIPGKRPKFMSKELFRDNFETSRKERSQGLEVELSEDGGFVVMNPVKDTFYEVLDTPDGLACSCPDWKNQKNWKVVEQPECKHCIAVKRFLKQRPLTIAC